MNTRILWTVLPNGITDDKHLRFSLYASPRLETASPATLASSPLSPKVKSLAARVASASVSVSVAGMTVSAKRVSLPGMPDPDDGLCGTVLPETTFVRGFSVPDHTGRNVRSFDVATVKAALGAVYAAAAAQGTQGFPSLSAEPSSFLSRLREALAQVGYGQGDGALANGKQLDALAKMSDTQLLEFASSRVSEPGMKPIAGEFLRAYFFYLRSPRHDYDKFEHAALALPTPEYHEIVSALGDNPTLLRQLGLVSDWIVEAPIVAGQMPGDMILAGVGMLPKEGTVALASISGFGEVPLEGPVTAYRISAAGFLARPDAARGTDIDEGLLRLSGKSPAFEVVQNDVDGGAIKLLDHAANLARHRTIQPASVDDAQSLPAGRSTGLTVARRGRAKVTKAAFAMAKTLDGTKSPTVYADDVRRGYRVDVYRAKTNKWYSLVARGGA